MHSGQAKALEEHHLRERERFVEQALIHVEVLRAAARRYVAREKADADDLVQDTLLRALVAWDQFRPGTDCRAWLLRILTNSFINTYRRARRERRLADHDDLLICPARSRASRQPESTLMELLLADEVLEALKCLPQEFRQVVVLADLEGASYREIAQQLGCPIGTVMSRLHRGRKMLEVELRDYARAQGILREEAA